MSQRNTVVRALHDLGLAAWFGGSLMGAVGVNGAAEESGSQTRTARIASAGWAKWAPWNAVAIAIHLIGGAALVAANRKRVRHQRGVGASAAAKTVLTAAALAATAYSRVRGKTIEKASSGDPGEAAQVDRLPVSIEQSQQQLRYLQWSIPVLTAALQVLNALHGEQQRGTEQIAGVLQRGAGKKRIAA